VSEPLGKASLSPLLSTVSLSFDGGSYCSKKTFSADRFAAGHPAKKKKYTKTHEYIGNGTITVTKTHPMPVPGVPGNRKRKKGPETSISSIRYSRPIAFFLIDPGV